MIRPALTHKARLCSAYNVLIKWHWDCYHLTCLISSFLEFLWRLGGPLATLGFSLQTRNKALIIAIRILLSISFIIALKRILSIFWFYRVKELNNVKVVKWNSRFIMHMKRLLPSLMLEFVLTLVIAAYGGLTIILIFCSS